MATYLSFHRQRHVKVGSALDLEAGGDRVGRVAPAALVKASSGIDV